MAFRNNSITSVSPETSDYLDNNIDSLNYNQWQTVRIVFDMAEKLFENYSNHCRDESCYPSLQKELELFRRKFQDNFNCLNDICQLFDQVMNNESNLVRVNDPKLNYHFFGDLHGSLSDMILIRTMFWGTDQHDQLSKNHFIFLGDYVDRGIHGFEVVIYLFLMKLLYQSSFTILRGNHEFSDMNRYSFLTEMQLKFGEELGYRMWLRLNDSFSLLPYAAIVCNNVFCCHGGIPKHLRSLEQIEQIPKLLTKDLDEDSIAFQLLWNDFYTKDLILSGELYREPKYFSRNILRGAGFMIGNRAAERFLHRFRLSYIVRAHQFPSCDPAGYDHIQLDNGAVFTLFSNSSYLGGMNNTAYLYISIPNEDVKVFPLVELQRSCEFFNQSELFETNIDIIRMKFKDPYQGLMAHLHESHQRLSYDPHYDDQQFHINGGLKQIQPSKSNTRIQAQRLSLRRHSK